MKQRLRLLGLGAALGLFAAACGGGEAVDTSAASSGDTNAADGASSPEELADANVSNLQPSDDVRDIEVLSVADGSITTLRDSVAGDRPILLWFYAPH